VSILKLVKSEFILFIELVAESIKARYMVARVMNPKLLP
jgi:hypothetical protein